jgi:hypothetical protein
MERKVGCGESNVESGKEEPGNEEVKDVNQGITGRATTPVDAAYTGITGSAIPWATLFRRAEDCAPYLYLAAALGVVFR